MFGTFLVAIISKLNLFDDVMEIISSLVPNMVIMGQRKIPLKKGWAKEFFPIFNPFSFCIFGWFLMIYLIF